LQTLFTICAGFFSPLPRFSSTLSHLAWDVQEEETDQVR
jgi:hypothetical protein